MSILDSLRSLFHISDPTIASLPVIPEARSSREPRVRVPISSYNVVSESGVVLKEPTVGTSVRARAFHDFSDYLVVSQDRRLTPEIGLREQALQHFNQGVALMRRGENPGALQEFSRLGEMRESLGRSDLSEGFKQSLSSLIQRGQFFEHTLKGEVDEAFALLNALPRGDAFRTSAHVHLTCSEDSRRMRMVLGLLHGVVEDAVANETHRCSRTQGEALRGQLEAVLQGVEAKIRRSEIEDVQGLRAELLRALPASIQYDYSLRSILQGVGDSGHQSGHNFAQALLSAAGQWSRQTRFAAAYSTYAILRTDTYARSRVPDLAQQVQDWTQETQLYQDIFNVGLITAESNGAVFRTGGQAVAFVASGGLANFVSREVMASLALEGGLGASLAEWGVHTTLVGASQPLLTPREEALTGEGYRREFLGMFGLAGVLHLRGMAMSGIRSAPVNYASTIGTMAAYDAAAHPELQRQGLGLNLAHAAFQDLIMRGGELLHGAGVRPESWVHRLSTLASEGFNRALYTLFWGMMGVDPAGGNIRPRGNAPHTILSETLLPPVDSSYNASYVEPNELYPQDAKPILERAPAGIYVAVGTERGFIGAALANATRLILVDMDPNAVQFNRVNRALLLIARDREDYLHLRLNANASEWVSRAHNLPENDVSRVLLEDTQIWGWWLNNVRINPRADKEGRWVFDSLHTGVNTFNNKYSNGEFLGVNYLLDNNLFSRVQRLAREGKIEAHLFNLSNDRDIGGMIDRIQAITTDPISVLDLSNVWYPAYLQPHGTAHAVQLFSSAMVDDSLILLMNRAADANWFYQGYSINYLLSLGMQERPEEVFQQIYNSSKGHGKNAFNEVPYSWPASDNTVIR